MARFRPDNALKVDFSQQYFQYFRPYLTGFEQYSGISTKQYLTDFNQYYGPSLRVPHPRTCGPQSRWDRGAELHIRRAAGLQRKIEHRGPFWRVLQL